MVIGDDDTLIFSKIPCYSSDIRSVIVRSGASKIMKSLQVSKASDLCGVCSRIKGKNTERVSIDPQSERIRARQIQCQSNQVDPQV